MAPNSSSTPFIDPRTAVPAAPLGFEQVVTSSVAQPWSGFLLEVLDQVTVQTDEFAAEGHLLVTNLSPHPFVFEARLHGTWKPRVMPPRSFFPMGAGEPFRHRVLRPGRLGFLTVEPHKVAALSGSKDLRIAPGQAPFEDAQLSALFDVLHQEVLFGAPRGVLFAEAIISASSVILGQRFGGRFAEPARRTAGLSPPVLRRVLDRIDAHPDGSVSIDELAREAGLSRFHFGRQFQRSTGLSPYRYALRRRLTLARVALLKTSAAIAEIAFTHGFADQSHFTRLFREEFGRSPGALRRESSARR